jgi:hypothetical protein
MEGVAIGDIEHSLLRPIILTSRHAGNTETVVSIEHVIRRYHAMG